MMKDTPNEVQLFQQFLTQQTASGNGPSSMSEALEQFSAYQRELSDLKQKLLVAEEQSRRGETGPFDAERTKKAVRERLAKDGITD